MTAPSRPANDPPSQPQRLPENLPEVRAKLVSLAGCRQRGRLADGRDAEDVVQDTLLKAMQTDSFQGQTQAELEAWLAVIARRRAANLLKREQRSRHVRERLTCWASASAEDAASACDARDVAEAALTALPEPDREILSLRLLGQMAWTAIGVQLDVPADAARKRAVRVLLLLRDRLSAEVSANGAPAGQGRPECPGQFPLVTDATRDRRPSELRADGHLPARPGPLRARAET